MIGVRSPFDDQYDGSRMFVWLADLTGLSVDLINFLLCQISALFLAALLRSWLHPGRCSPARRHSFGLAVGLTFGYFCFGQQAIHIVGLPALCYGIMRTQNPRIVQRLVMAVAMLYLSCVHIYRLYYDYGSTTIDITGPLMMITQKVTTLAFSLHDGMSGDVALTPTQRYHAVRRCPSPLEYFAFCLQFQSLLAGPIVLFRDYMDFVDGANFVPGNERRTPLLSGADPATATPARLVREPSPVRTVAQKLLASVLCAFVYMKFGKVYPVKNIKDVDFVHGTGFAAKLWFLMNATMFVRFKYYHAWLMGDAICNMSGLGFNGYDASGAAKWDLCSNIDIMGFEFATNFRDSINSWNLATNRWLRYVVYERVPKRYGTVLTFGLSAVWHGFYPGYYLTFASGALMVMAARTARKYVRHRFQHSSSSRQLYDILTVLITRVFMAYSTFPFVVLELTACLDMYRSIFLSLHLVAALTIVVVPWLSLDHDRTGGSSRPDGRPKNNRQLLATSNGKAPASHKSTQTSTDAATRARCERQAIGISGSNSRTPDAFDDGGGRHLLARQLSNASNGAHHHEPHHVDGHRRHFGAGPTVSAAAAANGAGCGPASGNGSAFMRANMANAQF